MIKTYRGLLADGGQDRIRLQTIKGKVGYRIIKLQVVGSLVGSASYESTTQIWKKEQASASATIDFTDSDLLAIGLWSSDVSSVRYNPEDSSACRVVQSTITWSWRLSPWMTLAQSTRP